MKLNPKFVELVWKDLDEVLETCFGTYSHEIQQHEWEMREFLSLVLTELRPIRTVELGTYKGWTSSLLSLITERKTITVDIENYHPEASRPFADNLTYILGDATNPDFALGVIEELGGPIDLLFIDDGHYYAQIVAEFDLWKPFVRDGGWIAFHDINPLANIGPHGVQPDCIQVTRYWTELTGNKSEIVANDSHRNYRGTLPHGGIGILRL